MTNTIASGEWYKLGINMVVCGRCALALLDASAKGDLTGDEVVTTDMFTRIKDADSEAYQCDDCLDQNDAYDELADEDD